MSNIISMYTLYRDYFPAGYVPYNEKRFYNLHHEIRDHFEKLQFKKRYQKVVFVTSPSPDIDLEFINLFGHKKDTCYASAYLMTQPLYKMIQGVMKKHVHTKISYTLVTIIENEIDFTRLEYKCLTSCMGYRDIYESIYRNCVTSIGIEFVKGIELDELYLVYRTIENDQVVYDIKRFDRKKVLSEIEFYIIELKKKGKLMIKRGMI